MKQPKKPTYNNKKLMSKNGLEPGAWSVVSETNTELKVISKRTGAIQVLDK